MIDIYIDMSHSTESAARFAGFVIPLLLDPQLALWARRILPASLAQNVLTRHLSDRTLFTQPSIIAR